VRNILIQGIDTLLGSYLAARCLQSSGDRVFYIAPDTYSSDAVADRVAHAAGQIMEGAALLSKGEEIATRLLPADFHAPDGTITRIDEAWLFAGPVHHAEALFRMLPGIGVKEFNYVVCDSAGWSPEAAWGKPVSDAAKPAEAIPDDEIARRCQAHDIAYRLFRTSLVLGSGDTRLEPCDNGLAQFLTTLHSFKAEIDERSDQYFDFQAVRCLAPPEAALNVITAAMASDLLLRIGRKPATAGLRFTIGSPQNTSFAALCERICIAYGLGLLAVEQAGDLNAIDRAFQERIGGFHRHLMKGTTEPCGTEAWQAADLSPDGGVLDEEAQITLFETFRRNQDKVRAACRQRVAAVPGRLTGKTILRGSSELSYVIGGQGPPVVILNALGQGLEYWYRLMENLMQHYRVIIWEPRGTVSPPPPFGLADQVEDLSAVLEHESIEACHLIGWCTGAKVAIDFYLRRPSAVLSMAFLNATFKCDGGPEELDSPYESNLESLCRMLVSKPATAATVMKSLQSLTRPGEGEILAQSDREQMSVSILSLMNSDLESCVVAPFRTEQTTLNYAHQLIDFWKHDARPAAAEVKVPVFLLATEYDQVATPETSAMAAGIFPNARHLLVRGATHYCLYDRPEFVAGMLRDFFETAKASVERPRMGADERELARVGNG
jgi:pimeloyl-ACP methyl ester carboxylesterase